MISGTYYLRNSLLLFILLLIGTAAQAQKQTTSDVPVVADSTIKKDSTQKIRVMIIPFNPSMYFSDADKDIAEISKMEKDKVRGRFNGSLETNLTDHLGLYYEAQSLSKQKDAASDLDLIFGSISYKPEEKAVQPEKSGAKSTWKDLKKKVAGEEGKDKKNNTVSYMNIGMTDNRLIEYLHGKYKSDFFIFINQFEVKTDYENCLDLAMRQYYREIKVHYTIFDKQGKFVSGDVITVPYHSNENQIDSIIRENFGFISSTILGRLYMKK